MLRLARATIRSNACFRDVGCLHLGGGISSFDEDEGISKRCSRKSRFRNDRSSSSFSVFLSLCSIVFAITTVNVFSSPCSTCNVCVCVCVCVFYRGTLLSKIREHLPNHAPRDLSPLEDETQSNYEVIFHAFSNPQERTPHDRTTH